MNWQYSYTNEWKYWLIEFNLEFIRFGALFLNFMICIQYSLYDIRSNYFYSSADSVHFYLEIQHMVVYNSSNNLRVTFFPD